MHDGLSPSIDHVSLPWVHWRIHHLLHLKSRHRHVSRDVYHRRLLNTTHTTAHRGIGICHALHAVRRHPHHAHIHVHHLLGHHVHVRRWPSVAIGCHSQTIVQAKRCSSYTHVSLRKIAVSLSGEVRHA